jgi:hypothetical protein
MADFSSALADDFDIIPQLVSFVNTFFENFFNFFKNFYTAPAALP